MSHPSAALRVPKAVRAEVDEIVAVTDGFCESHLDPEYGAICRKLVAKLARKRPPPLVRGDVRIWAAGVIYTAGSINFLFDRSQTPHLSGDQLATLLGVSKSTMVGKSSRIRKLLELDRLEVEFCRCELLEQHPLAWLVEVNGLLIDARMLPAELQAEARDRGMIPDLGDVAA